MHTTMCIPPHWERHHYQETKHKPQKVIFKKSTIKKIYKKTFFLTKNTNKNHMKGWWTTTTTKKSYRKQLCEPLKAEHENQKRTPPCTATTTAQQLTSSAGKEERSKKELRKKTDKNRLQSCPLLLHTRSPMIFKNETRKTKTQRSKTLTLRYKKNKKHFDSEVQNKVITHGKGRCCRPDDRMMFELNTSTCHFTG